MFAPRKPFQPSLVFVGKALPAHTRLGWEGLPVTNTLAYYGNPQITAVMSFMIQAQGCVFTKNLKNDFYLIFYNIAFLKKIYIQNIIIILNIFSKNIRKKFWWICYPTALRTFLRTNVRKIFWTCTWSPKNVLKMIVRSFANREKLKCSWQ